jgi:hypothetical protein
VILAKLILMMNTRNTSLGYFSNLSLQAVTTITGTDAHAEKTNPQKETSRISCLSPFGSQPNQGS